MTNLPDLLKRWGQSRCAEIAVGSLISRCPIAHKWKAPFRALVVREALLWRMHDLGEQILCLRQHGHILGERILIRAALETLAVLMHLNAKVLGVLEGSVTYNEFDAITVQLLLGSKNGATKFPAVNVLTALKHADKRYPGIAAMHEHFSESAHPNYSGVLCGYSTSHPDLFETRFANQFESWFGSEQEPAAGFAFDAFEHEYNVIWVERFSLLESWLRENNEKLEAARNDI